MSLIDELKRRNVFKVTAAYLALGWVVTQVTSTVAPTLHLPDWLAPVVVWIGVIGLPFVIIFSWIYELTPEGLKRESEVDRTASITHVTSRRLDTTIIALLVIAIGLFAFHEFRPATRESMAPAPVVTSSAPAPVTATPEAKGAVAVEANDKSIAVLPFVNMSEDTKNEFFSDGISEELLNLLAKIPELRVIARTSSFAFKGKEVEIADIAKKLNVAHVLEGSVRKSGNKVRITAQLIRASDSSHLWSETYDRNLDDIFALQDEIAAAVVSQLKITLLGQVPQSKKVDPRAYALYLQARQFGRRNTIEGFEQSIALYQQVLAIDPGYAAAWAGLASNYRIQAIEGLRPIEAGMVLARDAAGKALAIDPDSALAHAVLGRIALDLEGDLATAAQHLEHALALAPNDLDILLEASTLADSLGRLDQALMFDRYAVLHDPVNARAYAALGYDSVYTGDYDQAIASFDTALSLSPGWIAAAFYKCVALLLKGDPAAALAATQQESAETWRLQGLSMAYHALGRNTESDAVLAEMIRKIEKEGSYNIAYVLAWRNEPDRAFEFLDKAVIYHDAGLSEIPVQPLFAKLHKDSRWQPFLRKIGKTPEHLAAIKFDVELPQ